VFTRVIAGLPHQTHLAAGDLNGDGKLDLAATEATYPRRGVGEAIFKLHLLFQKGSEFAVPPDKSMPLQTPPNGLVLGDFDGDGRNDLVVGLRTRRSIALYTGADGFETARVSRYNNDSGARSLSAGRLNRRGLADFMTGAAWRKWIKEDRFENGYFSGPERNDNFRATLVDLSWNGLDDLVFTTLDNRIRILYGPFLSSGLIPVSQAYDMVTLTSPHAGGDRPVLGQVKAADLNGDAQPDLILGARHQSLVYLQNSPIGFSEGAGPSFTIEDAVPLIVDDLDGDELSDVVFRRADGKTLAIWRQQRGMPLSTSGVAEGAAVALPRNAVSAVAGDMDSDGRKEVFIGLTGGGLAVVRIPAAPQ